ncbi:MAG TPA: hypothetical protein VF414_17320 [Thermoanaerobaculia bacterium]
MEDYLLVDEPRVVARGGRDLTEPGDHPVDVPVVCVLTRFGLRHPLHLLFTYLDYRRTMKRAAGSPGLLRSAFLIESLTSCYSLSIWASPRDIPVFGRDVPEHVSAARNLFGRLAMSPRGGPELWSTKWRLSIVSNNLNWQDFDLRALILATREGGA